jgi:hypothetical protein
MNEAERKLKRIAEALRRFEANAEVMLQHGLDHAFWSGRLEAVKDIKDALLEGKEAVHGESANHSPRP